MLLLHEKLDITGIFAFNEAKNLLNFLTISVGFKGIPSNPFGNYIFRNYIFRNDISKQYS